MRSVLARQDRTPPRPPWERAVSLGEPKASLAKPGEGAGDARTRRDVPTLAKVHPHRRGGAAAYSTPQPRHTGESRYPSVTGQLGSDHGRQMERFVMAPGFRRGAGDV